MNGKTQFRISNWVLTIACILCGTTAASYLASQFIPRRNSLLQTTVAASAQKKSHSEFHSNRGHNSAPNHRPLVQTDDTAREMKSRPGEVGTTSVEPGVPSCESEGHAVSHFDLPVTVNPVIVNIDHSDIIREISRVHERLDLLSAEARTAHSRAKSHDSVAMTPVQQSEVQSHEVNSQNNVHDEPTNDILPSKVIAPGRPLVPATEPLASLENKSVSPKSPTTPRLPPSNPAADVTSGAPTVPLCETILPSAVANPAAAAAVAPPPVSVPERIPEMQFEITAHQAVADISHFEPPAAKSETFDPEALESKAVKSDLDSANILSIEFSADAFNIPEPKDVPGITPQNGAKFLQNPVSDFFDPITFASAPVPAAWPEFPGVATLAVPSSQSAKRTTDPPFMNARSRRVRTPPAQVSNGPIGTVKIGAIPSVSRMQPVSRTTQAAGKHAAQSDCNKCKVTTQSGNRTHRRQPVSSSSSLRRIPSEMSH